MSCDDVPLGGVLVAPGDWLADSDGVAVAPVSPAVDDVPDCPDNPEVPDVPEGDAVPDVSDGLAVAPVDPVPLVPDGWLSVPLLCEPDVSDDCPTDDGEDD